MTPSHGFAIAALIAGYQSAEFTHSAVAAYVASGMADVSFEVEAAARHFDPAFIPIITEEYLLACGTRVLEEAGMANVREMMPSEPFKRAVSGLAGYDGSRSGGLMGLDALHRPH